MIVMQQLDIFEDSIAVQRVNALIAALGRFDHQASQHALQAMILADSEYAGLIHFQTLCEFVGYWSDANHTPDWSHTPPDIAATVQMIETRIMPATVVMGDHRHALLHRIWFELARSSETASIGPEHGDGFAAELYLRAQQFPEAVRTAQRLPGADLRAAVQRWLGLGHYGCGAVESARRAALRYAWLAPMRFGAFVEEAGDAALARDWREFQSDLGDLDAAWFPAWCAHEKKASAAISDNLPQCDGATAYRLVTALIRRERGGLCAEVYEDRARLKRLNESFFEFYLMRRSA